MGAVSFARQALRQMVKAANFDRTLEQVHIVAFEPNKRLTAELVVQTQHSNLNGTLHGGFASTLADKMSSLCLISEQHVATQDNNISYGSSVNLNVNFVSASAVGSTLVIQADAVKIGSRLAHLQVHAFDKQSQQLVFTAHHIKSMK